MSIAPQDMTTAASASIELRLDKAHGTSAVTHLHNRNSTMQHQRQDLETIYRKCQTLVLGSNQKEHTQDDGMPCYLWIENFSLACAMEMVDKDIFVFSENLDPKVPNPSRSSPNLTDFLLSTRFGADRRLLVPAIESTDLTLRRQAARKAYSSSCDTLLNAIRLGCRLSTMGACGEDERQGNQVLLLSWLLLEDPTIVDDQQWHSNPGSKSGPSTGGLYHYYWKQVENVLVEELPAAMLKNDTIRAAIRRAGDLHGSRGELTIRRLDVLSGEISVFESCRGLTYAESFHLLRKLLS